jgi:glycerophosphoryl diester phosphodiesterase
MRLFPLLCLALPCLALAACAPKAPSAVAPADTAQGPWTIDPGADLNIFFECLEREGATLVSAHRGGYRKGLPENALETMRATMDAAPALLEVDIASSADGVLYLMHDETLERTTTGSGPVDALPFAEIARLTLEDKDGAATPYAPPRLEDALAFAATRTILKIDFKKSARFEDVIAVIRRARAASRVILIATNVPMAQKLHRLAPEMMISLTITSAEEFAAAKTSGVPADRLLAFTGTREPDAALYEALNAGDIEVIFGTLGREGLDAAAEATGDDTQYTELSRIGVDILATQRPIEAQRELERSGRAAKAGACGVRRAG